MSFSMLLKSMYPEHQFADGFSSLCLDSRKVTDGAVFIAIRGKDLDGWDFVEDAVSKGAKLILTNSQKWQSRDDIEVVYDPELSLRLGDLAGSFYDWPSKKLDVIGVTGTNGKTSVCQFTAQMLTQMGYPCAYIGTNGYGLQDEVHHLDNTTPDIVHLNQLLDLFVRQGAEYCAMEVSSHGLEQGRVSGIEFAATGFTNLTRDHLDFHKTMEAYGKAKSRLFLDYFTRSSIINIDDRFGQDLLKRMANRPGVYSVAIHNQSANICAENVEFNASGISFDFKTPWGSSSVSVPLYGEFNVANLLTAAGMILSLGVEFSLVARQIQQISPVSGRMEFIQNRFNKAIAIDYSHTSDSLQKALNAMRSHCPGKLWVVFGCGGDRDTGKRPIMASVANEYADQIIVTDDNPRTEDAQVIFNDIRSGFSEPDADHIQYEHNRKQAINLALEQSESGDAILIAGKGHEDYQIIGTKKYPFSDQMVVRNYLEQYLEDES